MYKGYQNYLRLELFKPNTAISATMEWLNDATSESMRLSRETIEKICVSLSVMAPHMASEILKELLNKQLSDCSWPSYDPQLITETTVTLIVQVNGKLRARITVNKGAQQHEIQEEAQKSVQDWLSGKTCAKICFVQDRLINFVIL